MNKVSFIVLIGIPGAGKTTFCEDFLRNMSGKCSPLKPIHICFDRFIRIDDNLDLETGSFKEKRKQLLESLGKLVNGIKSHDQKVLDEANQQLSHKFNEKLPLDLDHEPNGKIYGLFLDDNMYYRSMRYEIFALARKHRTGFLQLHLNVPLLEAKARNANRAVPIPEDIISRMWIKLEKPNGQFYKWERNTIELEGHSKLENYVEIEQRIVFSANSPEVPIEQEDGERQPVEQSTLHKVDLLLRKVVSDTMKERKPNLNGAADMKLLSEQLVNRRKAILADLRMGLIDINPQCATSEQIQSLF